MKRIETLLTVAGLGLFAFVVSKIGWSTVVYELRPVWIALPALVALSVARLLLQTQSWGWHFEKKVCQRASANSSGF